MAIVNHKVKFCQQKRKEDKSREEKILNRKQ